MANLENEKDFEDNVDNTAEVEEVLEDADGTVAAQSIKAHGSADQTNKGGDDKALTSSKVISTISEPYPCRICSSS